MLAIKEIIQLIYHGNHLSSFYIKRKFGLKLEINVNIGTSSLILMTKTPLKLYLEVVKNIFMNSEKTIQNVTTVLKLTSIILFYFKLHCLILILQYT